MKEFKFGCGTHLETAVEEMVAYAVLHGEAMTTFNNVTLLVNKDSTVQGVLADWHTQQDALAEAYRKSPEGIAAEKASRVNLRAAQDKYDKLLSQLPELDFANNSKLLDWFCQLEGTLLVGMSYGGLLPRVIETFVAHGYLPEANTGPAINREDADNVARYIIGQCLDTLNKHRSIPPVILHFTQQWKQKFGSETV